MEPHFLCSGTVIAKGLSQRQGISKCNGQRRLRWKTTVQVDAGYTSGSFWQVVLELLLMQDFFLFV